MKQMNKELQTLLELDGEAFALDPNHFTSFKVELVEVKKEVPHGIKYALCLIDKGKQNIIRYDNSHGYKEHQKVEWDHVHKKEKVFPYDFKSAGQLLEDFWNDVNNYLENLK